MYGIRIIEISIGIRIIEISIIIFFVIFSSQRSNQLQEDIGLYLALSGCSASGLLCGRPLGITCHPRTIQQQKLRLAEDNVAVVRERLGKAKVNFHEEVYVNCDKSINSKTILNSNSPSVTSPQLMTVLADRVAEMNFES